nr:helix-hairpin-helix domain-containing protein [Clostridium chrysemydis]
MEYSSKDESIEDIEIIEPEAEVNKAVEEINNLRTSGVKKEEVKVEYNKNSNLIDINSMDEDEIMKECGTNIILAKRVIRYRNEKGAFKNVDEFLELLSLPNSRREELKRRLKVKEEKRNTDYRQSRIVDF